MESNNTESTNTKNVVNINYATLLFGKCEWEKKGHSRKSPINMSSSLWAQKYNQMMYPTPTKILVWNLSSKHFNYRDIY